MLDHWQWVADEHDLRSLREARQNRGFDVHDTAHAVGVAVVLIEGKGIKAFLFGVAVFVNVIVVIVSSLLAIKKLIWYREERVVLEHLVFRYPPIRPLGEIADFHGGLSCETQ